MEKILFCVILIDEQLGNESGTSIIDYIVDRQGHDRRYAIRCNKNWK